MRLSLLAGAAAVPAYAGVCCYNSNSCSEGCNAPTEWCSQSEANCNKCSGHYCSDGPVPTPPPPSPTPSPSPVEGAEFCPSASDLVVAYGTLVLIGQSETCLNPRKVGGLGVDSSWLNP